MGNEAHHATWTTYQDAWADVTPAERQSLLSRSVAEDCVFADPSTEGHGLKALTAHIEQFQKLYPGASFKTPKLPEHHGQALAEWKMYGKDGAELSSGTSFARFGEDGRLTHLIGFFET